MTKISTISPGLAREYSAGSTYEVGQYVLWRNAYWKCTVAIPVPEEWTPAHWTQDDSPLDHKADLVDGKVPAAQLPSYVDDVVEGYYYDGAFYEDQGHSEEIVPEESKIYVDKSSGGGGKCYRWSGSVYVEISPAPDLSNYYNKGEVDGLLVGKASKSDATLTPVYDGNGKKFSDWACVPATYEGNPITIVETPSEEAGMVNYTPYSNGSAIGCTGTASEDILSLRWRQGAASLIDLSATRTANKFLGYQLGEQDDKLLASEEETEALRNGKFDKSGGTVVGTLGVTDPENPELAMFEVNPSVDGSAPTMRFGDSADVVSLRWKIAQTSDGHGNVVMEASNELGESRQITLPFTAGTLALTAGKGHAGNLAALDAQGNPVDSTWTAGDLAQYALVAKTISNSAVALDDRACNYVDARTLGSSDSLDVDFPALVDGKSRDFVLAVECGANPPTISYAAFVTIMAEDASSLTPEEGMNIYSFTEFRTNMFIAVRKLVSTVVDNSPESGDQILLAMQDRGIDTTGITDFGGVESALGLGDTDTPQDAIDAIMN